MSRIEEALRKLQDDRRRPADHAGAVAAEPSARGASTPFGTLSLDARNAITLDEVALRRWGPVALEGAERARREYGQIKRPIIENALGRGAAPTPAGNVVLVTSALAGEGKSLTALNLSLSLSLERDLSVVLIDADALKPDLSHTLKLDQRPGLTDLLADDRLQFSDVLYGTSLPNLYFIPAGLARGDATELIGSQRMRNLIERLSRDLPRTLVLIDSSPLLLTNETPVLASLAGQVVFVVRANQTPRLVLTEALDKVDPSKPVGLVLNGVSMSESGYYGSYGPSSAERVSAA